MMFKKFIPTISSANSHGITSNDTSSSSSNSGKSQKSEVITLKDIPSLTRGCSSTNNLPLGPKDMNEISEISIDPFDTPNTLKRAKSLQFEVSRKPSISSLKKKKSVRFDDETPKVDNKEVSIETQTSSFYNESNTKGSVPPDSMSNDNKYNNDFQRQFEVDDSNDTFERYSQNHEENIDQINENDDLEFNENVDWLNNVFKKTSHTVTELNLDTVEEHLTDYEEQPLSGEKSSEQHWSGEKSSEKHWSGEKNSEQLWSSDENNSQVWPNNSDDDSKGEEDTSDGFDLASDSSMEGLFSFDKIKIDKAESLMNEITKFIGIENYKTDVIGSLNVILTVLKDHKKLVEEKDLDISELVQLSNMMRVDQDKLNNITKENQELTNGIEQLKKKNQSAYEKLSRYEVDLHKASRDNTMIANKVDELESKLILTELSNKALKDKYDTIHKILTEKGGFDPQEPVQHKLEELFEVKEEMETQFVNMYNDKEEALDRITVLIDERDQYQVKCEALETVTKELAEQIELLNNEVTDLKFKMSLLKQENSDIILRENIEQTRRSLQLDISNQDIESLSIKLDSLKHEIVEKETTINEINIENFELQCKNLELQGEVVDLKEKVNKLESGINKVTKNLNNKTIDYRLLKNEHNNIIEKATKELIAREGLIEQLNSDLNTQSLDVETLTQTIEDLRIEVVEKAALILDLNNQLPQLYKEQDTWNHEKNQLIRERDSLTLKYEETTKNYEDMKVSLVCEKEQNWKLKVDSNKYSKSNDILLYYFQQLVLNLKKKLQPMMYDESIGYMTEICKPLRTFKVFNESNTEIFKEITQFVTKAVEDLVQNYLENESLLEREISDKSKKYNDMLNELSQIMIHNLSTPIDKEYRSLPKHFKLDH